MKRILGVLLSATMILVMAAGCKDQRAENASGKSGQEIVVGTNSESGGLDPAGMIADTYLAYSVSALDELLTYDENGEIEYRAAESYEVNDDKTEWIFHLREDAKWSDGTPVTSADFRNTIERSLDPASGNGYSNYLFPIENAEAIYNREADMSTLGVETPDDTTLIFHLSTPCVYFLDLLRLPVYTPSCVVYADAVGSGWDTDPATSVSNGPFYLTEYVPQQYFVLEKNPYYWDADNIALDKITYKFFDNKQSMAAAYATGEVDVALSLLGTVMDEYEGQDDLVVTDAIATRYIYMNIEKVEVLQDVRVRGALNLGIDRQELCQAVGKDTEPTVNFVAKYMVDKSTGEYFVDGAQAPFEENLKRAKELLAEAGYPNGEGFPVLTYNYPTLEMDMDTAQVLQQQLKENLGITIELNGQELQVNYSERRAGNFELCRMNWTADFADPNTYLSMLLSNSTYNCSGIRDEVYDALVEASDTETDPAKRSELMHEAEQYAIGEQFYIIPLYSMHHVNLIRPNITGITQIPATGTLDLRGASVQ